MTDTRAWITSAQSTPADHTPSGETPADVTPTYGAAEVAYALSLTEGDARRNAETFLQVAPDFVTEQIAALGASSLLARGELTVDGDDLLPRGGLRLLIAVLQSAERWTEIGLIDERGVEAAVYVQSRALSIFLQPAAMSTWVMVVKAPAAPDAGLLLELIENNAARHPLGVAYFGTEAGGAEKQHLFVRPDGAGRWDVADVEAPGDGRSDGVTTDELSERLAAFVALPA